jgi:hypothetical protein
MERFRKAARRWWDGIYVPYDNPPGSDLIFLGGTYERHWTAAAARAAWSYFRDHHRWIIGTIVAVAALLIARG